MKLSQVPLTGGARQTGKLMHKLAQKYSFDMAPYASLPPAQMFRILSNVPFKPDPRGHELLQRPKFTMTYGGDCDDKSIASAAYAIITGLKYRFRAIGFKIAGKTRIPLTHVFTEIKINREWVAFDCTYAYNIFGQRTNSDRSEFI